MNKKLLALILIIPLAFLPIWAKKKRTSVNKSNRGITSVAGMTFANRTLSIDLSRNQIADLTGLTLPPNLLILSLDENQILDFSPLVFPDSLDFLILSDNPGADLSTLDLSTAINLNTLFLNFADYNDLTGLSLNSSIEQLSLLDNEIETLKDNLNLDGAGSLKILDLTENKLTDQAVADFDFPENIETLRLEDNLLVDARVSVNSLPDTLEELDIAKNNFNANVKILGPDAFEGTVFPSQLEFLDISNTVLTDSDLDTLILPDSIKKLSLRSNPLTNLSDFVPPSSLEELNMSGAFNAVTTTFFSRIETIPAMPNLRILNLGSNDIRDLSSVDFKNKFPKLEELDLSANEIQEIDPDAFPPTLKRIFLKNTSVILDGKKKFKKRLRKRFKKRGIKAFFKKTSLDV